MSFSHIRVSDLVLVNSQGEVVEGEGSVNTAAFAIHSTLHEARPDIIAAAHSHSLYGKAWSSLGRLLDPLTQDACAFYDDHALFDDYTGVVLDQSEGKRIAPCSRTARRSSCATTGCSPSATRSRKRCGGSSPWSARARRSCWPRPRARRSRSATKWRAHLLAGRRAGLGLRQLPAAVPEDHPRAARPLRLTHPSSRVRVRCDGELRDARSDQRVSSRAVSTSRSRHQASSIAGLVERLLPPELQHDADQAQRELTFEPRRGVDAVPFERGAVRVDGRVAASSAGMRARLSAS